MQGIEQVLVMLVYLFWVLVFGFLLIAWRPNMKKKSRPIIPVTGCEDGIPPKDCNEDKQALPEGQVNGRRK